MIPRVLGDAVGLSPLLVLFSITSVALLFGEFAVLLAIPLAAVLATLLDVIVRGKDPAEEDVPTVIFSPADSETALLGLAPAAEDEAAEGEAEPEGADGERADRQRPCGRPRAAASGRAPPARPVVSGSPRRCLRSAPPARSPR